MAQPGAKQTLTRKQKLRIKQLVWYAGILLMAVIFIMHTCPVFQI